MSSPFFWRGCVVEAQERHAPTGGTGFALRYAGTMRQEVRSVGPPKHILIVDDDAATRTAMTLVLEGTGYRVASASDGREALDYLQRSERPDLILLDLMMPRMDGWQFRDQQWRSPALASI